MTSQELLPQRAPARTRLRGCLASLALLLQVFTAGVLDAGIATAAGLPAVGQASAAPIYLLSAPRTSVPAGAPLQLELTILNGRSEPLAIELPPRLHLRFETAAAVGVLEFAPERSGTLQVAAGGFVRIALRGHAPPNANGVVTVTSTGLATNELALQIQAPAAEAAARNEDAVRSAGLEESAANAAGPPPPATADQGSRKRPASAQATALVDKPPPLAVSVYEPVYFIVGGDDGLNAKFQLSLRYRLFDDRGRLARRLPWIDDLYLSFSQTSLWDLNELSKPFRDSSYRPRLFYSNYHLGKLLDGRLRLGVEAGAGHESNGKDAQESRSFNMLYVRPALSYGDPEGLRLYFAPLIHNYIADGENPDLKDYRGYVDWLFGFGSKGGLDVWATVRKGERSDFGSVELNASYPLSKLSGGDLTGWLMLQYFGGYGESLLDYSRKLDAQLRLGIAIAL